MMLVVYALILTTKNRLLESGNLTVYYIALGTWVFMVIATIIWVYVKRKLNERERDGGNASLRGRKKSMF